jgi:hypothetical protein
LTAKPVMRAGGASAPSAALAAALLLSACGSDDDPGPGGVTVGEARALDEAAEMIEARRLPPEALRPPATSAPLAPGVPQ